MMKSVDDVKEEKKQKMKYHNTTTNSAAGSEEEIDIVNASIEFHSPPVSPMKMSPVANKKERIIMSPSL